MKESYLKALENHKSKIEKFISKYEILLSENMELKERVSTLEKEVKDYKEEKNITNDKIKELEQKIDRMQMTGAFLSSSTDVKEARQNINRLVREIDKCILLLNDE